jgi:CheY-like chemotaxis protein
MEESVPVAGGSESEPAPVRSVLVVDDEEPIRNAVCFTLQEAGYTVLEAPDGRVGLDLLRASDAPLVIPLDLMMPGMSGIELLRAVAPDPPMNTHHPYIIFSAARAFSAPILHFYLPGKRLFDLPKPLDLDELVAVVDQAARALERECVAGAAAAPARRA